MASITAAAMSHGLTLGFQAAFQVEQWMEVSAKIADTKMADL